MTGGDRVKATMKVVAVGRCQSSIDLDPVYAVDLLVSSPGRPPEAVATSLRVPLRPRNRGAGGTVELGFVGLRDRLGRIGVVADWRIGGLLHGGTRAGGACRPGGSMSSRYSGVRRPCRAQCDLPRQ
jgi:hypothetical protein